MTFNVNLKQGNQSRKISSKFEKLRRKKRESSSEDTDKGALGFEESLSSRSSDDEDETDFFVLNASPALVAYE
ncbi:unnamed protein product [Ilex paraguariensis]|uniref:Uncharacterized protein n=1 Tax=Ilex paraguariensis TaxID=185542 RepID=A0ABC8RN01_9AQUA